MTNEAFGSRRVTESLRAIHGYIKKAERIAAGVLPSDPPKPVVRSVVWKGVGKTITLGPNPSEHQLEISGDHLDDVFLFKLTGPAPLRREFVTRSIQHTANGFTATIGVDGNNPGKYDATVADGRDAPMFPDACEIVRENVPSEVQLGGLVPNALNAGEQADAYLVVLKGKSESLAFKVQDLKGNSAKLAVSRNNQPIPESVKHTYEGAQIVSITIDTRKAALGAYALVATSDGHDDRITFVVSPSDDAKSSK